MKDEQNKDSLTDYVLDRAREEGISLRAMQERILIDAGASDDFLAKFFDGWED